MATINFIGAPGPDWEIKEINLQPGRCTSPKSRAGDLPARWEDREGDQKLNSKSRITITIMLVIFTLSVLSLVRNGEDEISFLTVQLSIFSVASISSAFARVFFNKSTLPTRNHEVQEFLPSGWQFIKFLAAFFISSVLFLLSAKFFVHTSLEVSIFLLVNCVVGVPVVVVASLITFWILKKDSQPAG